MLKLKKITLPNGRAQWCLLKGPVSAFMLIDDCRLVAHQVKSCSSDIFVDHAASVFLKAPPIKSFLKDNLVKIFCWTPADREFRGSRILGKLGLQTSSVLVRAIPLNPFSPYRSLLYSKYIPDALSLRDFLNDYPDSPERQPIMDEVATQLSLMFRNGVSFRDFYFGNLLYSPEGELFWIDAEVQKYWLRKGKPRRRFLAKKDYMHARFLRTGGTPEEWRKFLNVLLD